MKIIYRNLTIVLAFFLAGLQVITAQKFEKKYHESFKVNKDVVISLNTFYTDVVIETWNRNTVDVSAIITVEGKNLNQEKANKYFKNWQFEALGNHQKIKITGNNNRFIGFYSNLRVPGVPKTPPLPEIVVIPELSIKNLDILDSVKLVAPVVNDFVFEAMALNSLKLDSISFDFEAYKKDKNYLKKYQKRAYAQASKIRQQMLKDTVLRKKRVAELKRVLAEAKLEMESQRKEFAVQRQVLLKHRKEMRSRQRDAAKKIRAVLVKRNKVKLKKTIYIKVPKGAKFNMNVSYGSVKFPS